MNLLKLQREGFTLGDAHPAINGIKMFLNRHRAVSESHLPLNANLDDAAQTNQNAKS